MATLLFIFPAQTAIAYIYPGGESRPIGWDTDLDTGDIIHSVTLSSSTAQQIQVKQKGQYKRFGWSNNNGGTLYLITEESMGVDAFRNMTTTMVGTNDCFICEWPSPLANSHQRIVSNGQYVLQAKGMSITQNLSPNCRVVELYNNSDKYVACGDSIDWIYTPSLQNKYEEIWGYQYWTNIISTVLNICDTEKDITFTGGGIMFMTNSSSTAVNPVDSITLECKTIYKTLTAYE